MKVDARRRESSGARRACGARARLIALLALVAAVAGCATARIETEWQNPDFAGRSIKGGTVLVLCMAADEALRRICEDEWARRLEPRGLRPVRAYQVAELPPGGQANPAELQAAARKRDAASILSTRLAGSRLVVVDPGPQVGVGIGGYGGSGGGVSVGGIGISFPIGGGAPAPALSASTSLVDATSNALMWSGSASAPGSDSPAAKVAALTQVTVDALLKAGLL